MNIYFIVVVTTVVGVLLYNRYFPIVGIPCMKYDSKVMETFILDIRDYNEKILYPQADLHLPYAYLRRYKEEIPNIQLHVVARDRVQMHLGIRFLLRQGHKITSYQLTECSYKKNVY